MRSVVLNKPQINGETKLGSVCASRAGDCVLAIGNF